MELVDVQKEAESAGRKAIVFGVMAMLFAGFLGWLLARLNSDGPQTQSIVVAAENIDPLVIIKANQLKMVQWPVVSMPAGTFGRIEDIVSTKQLSISGLVIGEPILATRLSTPDRGLGISQLIEPNMRGFVLPVSDALAKSQILHPGAFVDVVATFTDTRTHNLVAKTVLQNIQVIAVGDSVDVQQAKTKSNEDNGAQVEKHRVITLMVSVHDSEVLAFASSQGHVDVVLRSNADNNIIPTQGADLYDTLGTGAARPALNQATDHLPEAVETAPRRDVRRGGRNSNHNASGSGGIYKIKH